MKLLSPRVHGYIDYLFDLVLVMAPSLYDMSPLPSTLLYVLAAAHFVMNLVTRYPLGVLRWMRFSTHGAFEVWAAVALVLLPWVAGFTADGSARNFYVVAGIALFGVWAVTNYRDDSVAADTIELGVRPFTPYSSTDETGSRRAS
jgi:hypothetical protein